MRKYTINNVRTSLNPTYIRSVLDYNPLDGTLVWKPKPPKSRTDKSWNARYAGKEAGTIQASGHRNISLLGEKWLAHRIAWVHFYGEWPEGILDHINQDPADNRIENLREVSWGINVGNSKCRSDNTSGVKGVYWHKASGRWHVCIWVDGLKKSLGYFNNIEEAKQARHDSEILYWGFNA